MPRAWIGTWNNPPQDRSGHTAFKDWAAANTTYTIFEDEIGESGTPHIQSFTQMATGRSFQAFQVLFPAMHVTPFAKGLHENGRTYCMKGENVVEVGVFEEKQPGKRTDLAKAAALCMSGKSQKEIADLDPTIILAHPIGAARLCSLYQTPRDRNKPKTVFCYHGATGTGKTRKAFDDAAAADQEPFIWDPGMNHWFDGYSDQKFVIMDEFRGQLPLGNMLRLTDRYPMRVQWKGGSSQFTADTIIITSPMHPRDWYVHQPNDRIGQLLRRFSLIQEFT